jgi:hypothetical protein
MLPLGMDSAILVVMRLRVELNRMLRTRAFHSRATRGILGPAEYTELVEQYGALVDAVHDRPLRALADADLGPAERPRACDAARFLRAVVGEAGGDPEVSRLTVLAAIGTSWIDRAVRNHAKRYKTTFLRFLEGEGHASVERLSARVGEGNQQAIVALAEATRGAVLGVAAYLDITWPPPVFVVQIDKN